MKFDGYVTLEVEIDEIVMPIGFYITKKLPVSVLLGWDWIKENDIIIRPNATHESIWSDSILTVMEDFVDPEPIVLKLMTDKVIPANTIAQSTVYVPNQALAQLCKSQLHLSMETIGSNSELCEVEMYVVPHPEILSKGILAREGLIVVAENGLAQVKIANPTDDIIKIPANTAIISAVNADEFDIMDSAEIHR